MAKSTASRKSSATNQFILAHVTHEAVDQLGGIGTVLEGLMVSPVYQRHVKRSLLIGPTQVHAGGDPASRLGPHGKLLYSSADHIDRAGLGVRLRPIEWAFDVAIVYGTRVYDSAHHERTGEAEVLLIDVTRPNPQRLGAFKHRLWEAFGLDSTKYEHSWDYEEYVRLAEPAFYALAALLRDDETPCVVFSHEFMGMPTVLATMLDDGDRFRTVFHAHECATARRLVEDHDGHDTMFYNVLDRARKQNLYVEDVFGKLDYMLRHALISRSYLCDGIIAVGDRTRDELKFLNERMAKHPIDLLYNGIPAASVTLASKLQSRKMLEDYSEAVLGFRPDVLMTHVTRPVISKGLWRDLKVCHELDTALRARKQRAVLYILTSAGGTRSPQDVQRMESEYGWPLRHRQGYPDLVGPEVDIFAMVEPFNTGHTNVQVVLVNQFGWSRDRIGRRLPATMDIADLRRATDVELGLATYEPFGISPLEPLGAGALCVISNICGCWGFVQHVTQGRGVGNVIVADFVRDHGDKTVQQLLEIGRAERDALESQVAADVARTIVDRLPRSDADRAKLIATGQRLVQKMGWDQVVREGLLPMLQRIVSSPAKKVLPHAAAV